MIDADAALGQAAIVARAARWLQTPPPPPTGATSVTATVTEQPATPGQAKGG